MSQWHDPTAFPERLTETQRQPDDLAVLGEVVKADGANVIKLPNISASTPQLIAAVKELQSKGYSLPDYPDEPVTEAEKEVRARYDAIRGSAVNPVLREGNSDRRAASAVKNFAKAHPHSMGVWSPDSKTHVTSMSSGDFFDNEVSATLTEAQAGPARIELVAQDGAVTMTCSTRPSPGPATTCCSRSCSRSGNRATRCGLSLRTGLEGRARPRAPEPDPRHPAS